jgi:hypothetical protein
MRLVIVAVVAALVVPATAGAQAPTGLWSLSSDGHPRVGNALPVSVDALRYCASGGGCTELDDISLPYEPGDVAAGTFYEADVFGVTQRSTVWTGRVGSTLEPTMRGTLALGATLTPVAAQWTGGWGDDVSRLSLYICRSEGGDDCVFSTGAVRAEHNGRYAFSVDSRAAKNDHVPASPADGATAILPSRTATVAVSAAAGPISSTAAGAPPIPAPKAPGGSPGTTPTTPKAKKPKVTLRKRALRSGKRLTVGSITCATRCRVRLSVGDGRRTVRRSLSVSGMAQLRIVNASKLRKKVRLRVVVTVDGTRLKTGRVRG